MKVRIFVRIYEVVCKSDAELRSKEQVTVNTGLRRIHTHTHVNDIWIVVKEHEKKNKKKQKEKESGKVDCLPRRIHKQHKKRVGAKKEEGKISKEEEKKNDRKEEGLKTTTLIQ